MLIRKEHTTDGALLGVWKMDESKEELLELFPQSLKEEAYKYLKTIRSERRSIEWLSTRVMLSELLGKDKIIRNHEDGRPYISDATQNISITHTINYAAILLHDTFQVGIDIETRSERVKKIADKFISENEYIDPKQKSLHQLLHWSTKESMFKLMNEQGIDFKEQLHIKPFIPSKKGIIKASESKTERQQSFDVNYEVYPEYVLTWIVGNQIKEK